MKKEIVAKELLKNNLKIDSFEKLPYGAMRNTYLIRSGENKFILKIYENSEYDKIRKLVRTLRKINRQEVVTIDPIFAGVLKFGNEIGFIYPFFDGKEYGKITIKNKLYEFSKNVGEFNKVVNAEIIVKNESTKKKKLLNLIKKDILGVKKTVDFLKSNSRFCESWIVDLLERAESLLAEEFENIEGRIKIIHGDLHYENMLYDRKSKKYLVIDIFNLDNYFIQKEIMVIISHLVTNSQTKNSKIITESLKGYELNFKLSNNEKSSIPFFMLLHKTGEVNWLINRYKDRKISKEVFDKYMAIDPKQLKIILNQYLNLKKLLAGKKSSSAA